MRVVSTSHPGNVSSTSQNLGTNHFVQFSGTGLCLNLFYTLEFKDTSNNITTRIGSDSIAYCPEIIPDSDPGPSNSFAIEPTFDLTDEPRFTLWYDSAMLSFSIGAGYNGHYNIRYDGPSGSAYSSNTTNVYQTDHQIELGGLYCGTRYTYQIINIDSNQVSPVRSFETLPCNTLAGYAPPEDLLIPPKVAVPDTVPTKIIPTTLPQTEPATYSNTVYNGPSVTSLQPTTRETPSTTLSPHFSTAGHCGNNIIESPETCDDGDKNGTNKTCSAECQTISLLLESSFIDKPPVVIQSPPSKNIIKRAMIDTLGPRKTDKIIKASKKAAIQTVHETVVVSKYSLAGVSTLLAILFIALNIMIFRRSWTYYTVQTGDSIDSIATQFNMVNNALMRKNPHLKNIPILEVGTQIKVKNRHFIERDYLDQLKFVLDNFLENRHYIR